MPPGRVEIVAHDGRTWLMEGKNVPGNADNPLDWDAIAAKFRECTAVAACPLADAQITEAVQLARTLEDLPDATVLIRSLATA